MPYVSSSERVGISRGLHMGIEGLLQVRFGAAGLQLMPQIEEIYEEEKLREILLALKTGAGIEELRRLCAQGASEGGVQE